MATTIDLGQVVPQKGVDYFTNADKTEIETAVQTNLAPELAEKETKAHLTTTIDENSTNEQYPGAEAAYNKFVDQDDYITALENENEALLAQIPTATATGDNINVQDSSNLPIKDFAMTGNATQADTPTPSTPQDIHVVTGDNTYVVHNKNLLAPTISTNTVTAKGMTLTYKNTGEYILTDTATSSGNIVAGNLSKYYTIKDGDYLHICNDKTPSGTIQIVGAKVGGGQSFAITINSTNKIANLSSYAGDKIQYFFFYLVSGASVTNMKMTPMIIHNNSTVQTFEPYSLQTQLLSLGNIKLARILNTDITDVMFKAVSSNNPLKPSYYDTLPSEVKASLTIGGWYKQGNIGEIVLTGTETFYTNTTATEYNSFTCTAIASIVNKTNALNIMCNMLTPSTSNVVNTCRVSTSSGNIIMFFSHEFCDYTSTAVKAKIAQLYSQNTPLYFKYALATPTYTEITDTTLKGQLENILAMHTNKNVTNAWIEPSGTNAQGGLTLTYYQDLETLLNDYEIRIELLETE